MLCFNNETKLFVQEMGLLDQKPGLEKNVSREATSYFPEDSRWNLGQTVKKMNRLHGTCYIEVIT